MSHIFRFGQRQPHRPANLTVCRPFMVPFNDRSSRFLNRLLVVRSVKRVMRRLKMRPHVVLTTFPHTLPYVRSFSGAVSIYYCVDEFSAWENVNARLIRRMEAELVQTVDTVVASSEKLYQSKKSLANSINLLTHGVDVAHFATTEQATEPPPRLRGLPRPMIGFFGIYDDRLDLALLRRVASARPSWSFVLIGKVQNERQTLKGRNCHFLGPVAYQDLPAYAQWFDVAILPYKMNEFTESMNPLQLKEYLAAGKPVVATPIPAVMEWAQYVHVAGTPDEFVRAIESCLHRGRGASKTEILDSVKMEDWSVKAERLSSIMETFLEKRKRDLPIEN